MLRLRPSRARRAASVSARAGAPAGKALGGHAGEQVGIGRERGPDGALRGGGHAGKVAVQVQRIDDELQVEVGRPAAVDRRGAQRGDLLSGGDGLADGDHGERFAAQVTVEREERRPVAGGVAQQDDRAVILGRLVVGHGVDDAGQRGKDGAAGRCKEVEPQVHRAPRRGVARALAKERPGVDQPRLVILPDAQRAAVTRQLGADARRERPARPAPPARRQ